MSDSDPANSPTKHVLILDEGSGGHLVQSRGLVRELGKRLPLEVEETRIRCLLPRKITRSLGKRFLKSKLTAPALSVLHYGTATERDCYDLVISSGPHSLNYLRHCGSKFQCPTIFVQGTVKLPEGQVSMVVRPNEGQQRSDYVFIPLLFTEIQPDELASMRPALSEKYGLNGDNVNALFIGNSSGKIQFQDSDWEALANFVNQSWEQTQTSWLLSTSYRTGANLDNKLRSLIKPEALHKAVWYSQNPERITKEYLSLADSVVVTMDSLTMATEAICSGKPSYLFCTQQNISNMAENTHTQYIANLFSQGLAQRIGSETSTLPTASSSATPDYSEAISEILKRLNWA